jgi:O-antigen/teichoic acid export membrane protein
MVKDSFFTYLTMVLSLVLSTLVAVIVTRTMGVDGKGQVTLILSIENILLLVATLGITQSTIFFIGKKKLNINELITATWILTIIQSIAVAILIWPLWILGKDSFFKGLTIDLLVFIALILPFEFLFNYTIYLFRGLNKSALFNRFRFARSASYFILLGVLWLLKSVNLNLVMLTFALSLFVTTLIAQIILFRLRDRTLPLRLINFDAIKALTAYGLQLYPTLILAYLGYRLDVFIVNSILTVADVGIYSIAVSFSEFIWYIPNSIGIVLFPMIARMNDAEANKTTPLVIRQVLLVTLIPVIGLAIMGHLVISLMFSESVSVLATPVMLALLPGTVAFSALKIIWQDLCGRGRPMTASLSMAMVVVVDVAVNFMITPHLKIVGAGVSASFSYLAGAIFITIIYSKISKTSIREIFTPTNEDFSLYKRVWAKIDQRFPIMRRVYRNGIH